MKAKEFAEELLKHPELEVVFGDDRYGYRFGMPIIDRFYFNLSARHRGFQMCYSKDGGTEAWVLTEYV